MQSLVDRVCEHGYVYCPVAGCHDAIAYEPPSAGVVLLFEAAEGVANDDLAAFYTRPDTWTGYDGADEAVEAAFVSLTLGEWDKNEGWCEG